MADHDVIVIGASAGGITALRRLFQALPADLPAAIAVVQHTGADSPGMLDRLLVRDSPLTARKAEDRMPLELGAILVAPPDHHLLIEPGQVRVVRGPRENLHRPSIDPLFRSAAGVYGPRVVGVVLTGSLDDGTAGLQAIRSAGGVAMVQDPEEAEYPSMPRNARLAVGTALCLPLAGIAAKLVELAGEASAPVGLLARDDLVREAAMATGSHTEPTILDGLGQPSYFSCPECHGILWELDDEAVMRFRCHVGHAFSSETLHAGQASEQERALWVALRTLEEQTALFTRMAGKAQARGQTTLATRFRQRVDEFRTDATTLRAMLYREIPPSPSALKPSLAEPGP